MIVNQPFLAPDITFAELEAWLIKQGCVFKYTGVYSADDKYIMSYSPTIPTFTRYIKLLADHFKRTELGIYLEIKQ